MKTRYKIHPDIEKYYTAGQLKRVKAEYKVHPMKAKHNPSGLIVSILAYCKGYATAATESGIIIQGWAGEFTIIP